MEDFSAPAGLGHPMSKWKYKYTVGISTVIVSLAVFYFLFLSAPKNFPVGAVVKIEPGMNLRGISSVLQQQNIIRFRPMFESWVIIFGREKNIISADYFFEKKLPVFEVAWRIGKGKRQTTPVSVTIPEGFNAQQIADLFASQLSNFDKEEFLRKAEKREGYLFPDTYFFLTNANEDDVLKYLQDNFDKKFFPLLPEISSFGKNPEEIVIMASILEREAEGDSDRGIISGILWKRLSIGMPLQVDAALETYKTKGLPKKPISNPGLEAIQAAIKPQSSPYLYYLHDQDGNIHYAKNFSEHLDNKSKYLR